MAQQLHQPALSFAPADDAVAQHHSQWSLIWRRFRTDKVALVGATIVGLLVIAAIFAPWLAPHDPSKIYDNGLTLDGLPVGPSREFLLGADALGRDQLSRILFGARVSLLIGVVANGIAMFIGILVGASGGYFVGWVGAVMMRLTDIMMSFPILLLAIALVAVLKPSIWIVIFVIAFSYWAPVARIVHGQVLAVKNRDFIEAARALGVGDVFILIRHVLPQILPIMVVYITLGIATNVLFEAALSFLGVGVQPPTPSWGGMISEGQTFYRTAPWLVMYPGLAIMLTVLGFNLLGDGLRDALDPRRRY